MKNYHIVQRHDTLSRIAKQYGISVADLRRLNELPDPDKLEVDQKIALRKEAICGFEALFLDADRNPIQNLEYVLEYCGKTIKGFTGSDGKSRKIITDWPDDTIRIMVKRFDGTIKHIAAVMSGYRNKLCTLISPLLVFDAELKPHPPQVPGARPNSKESTKPAYGKHNPAKPASEKKKLGPNARQTKTADGKPLTVVEGDIPALDFLGGYTGEKITDADYDAAAKQLGCEVEVIKAIAKQETGKLEALGIGAFDKYHRPTILYERHIFSSITNGIYDNEYRDLSNRAPYLAGTAKDKKGMKFDDGEHYGLFSWQYKKLSKACQLDKERAIQACSWGKFQVLGANYKLCGFSRASDFAKAMCKSEKEHLNVMIAFCKGNNLEKALNKKDWAEIARVYNGKQYKKNKYDTELQAHYEAFKSAPNK